MSSISSTVSCTRLEERCALLVGHMNGAGHSNGTWRGRDGTGSECLRAHLVAVEHDAHGLLFEVEEVLRAHDALSVVLDVLQRLVAQLGQLVVHRRLQRLAHVCHVQILDDVADAELRTSCCSRSRFHTSCSHTK